MNLLFDVETTGLDTNENHIIEIGAQLTDDNWNVQEQLSMIISNPAKPEISELITSLTGINQEMVEREGVPLAIAAELLSVMGMKANYAIAFNAEFDSAIFKTEMARNALTMLPGINNMVQVPWLCAMKDIESNYEYKCWKLSHLALDRGVAIDPATLHRAINDVELMRTMLLKIGAKATDMFIFQQIPWVYVAAAVPAPWLDKGAGVESAKAQGYNWQRAKNDSREFEKTWVKKIKLDKLDDEITKCPFKIRTIGDMT
jgi:DNA polymerase III alpha subunit (gram-positive type)